MTSEDYGSEAGVGHLLTPRVRVGVTRAHPRAFVFGVAAFVGLAILGVGLLVAQGAYNEKGIWVENAREVSTLVACAAVGFALVLTAAFFWRFGLALGRAGSSHRDSDLLSALRAELHLLRVLAVVGLLAVLVLALVVARNVADQPPVAEAEESSEAEGEE